MKTKYTMILIAASLAFATPAFSQGGDTGRCGQPRGTCGNECDGSGCLNQGRGNGNGQGQGQGQGFRRGKKDGSCEGEGQQDRERRRDGSGNGSGNGRNRGA
jgi:hypothetical protein